jgi:tellurite resistance protein TehA-like permease
MAYSIKKFWTKIAVVILGLFVGIYNLILWIDDNSLSRELIIGAICTLLATIWLLRVLITKNSKMKKTD